MKLLSAMVLSLTVAVGSSAPVAAEEVDDLDLAVSWMTGSFTSAAQAESDTNYLDIRLTVVPVWEHRSDGRWLYVEQALAGHLDHPYRQRVYHVMREPDGAIRSEIYGIPGSLRFAGAWAYAEPLSTLTPDSLAVREGCSVTLVRTGDGRFEGGTRGTDCPSSLRGAAYATSEVVLTPGGLVSWDRGFDEDGVQVWGAEGGGYVFVRAEPEDGE